MANALDSSITEDERRIIVKLEDTMGKIHRVSDALRMIDCPRQPPEFKAMLRSRLGDMFRDMQASCVQWTEKS
ncbi:MAG: hypothetical protein C0421_05785 [Hyphomonas sp.]|uniref:hypothetical protein n=1 Tax=Hyphomonas sp. TaxID=87 RepID=UPI0025C60AA9|nr:hypothetical protein [Hyphomonas sp.]MBA4338337.1 hypothetical protein [Hyphomonas sp.]